MESKLNQRLHNFLSEKRAIWLIIIGFALFLLGLLFFLFRQKIFDLTVTVDSSIFGQFGDLIGGLVGSIWALAGVILFYVALIDQRKDIELNRTALENQINEFKAQKEELKLTRELYEVQTSTAITQRFENTLFKLIDLHVSFVNNLRYESQSNVYIRGSCFRQFYVEISSKYDQSSIFLEIEKNFSLLSESYNKYGKENVDRFLTNYFKNLENIIFYIDKSEGIDAQFYVDTYKSIFSKHELLLLFLYTVIRVDSDIQPLFEKYGFFEFIDFEEKLVLDNRGYFDKKAYMGNDPFIS